MGSAADWMRWSYFLGYLLDVLLGAVFQLGNQKAFMSRIPPIQCLLTFEALARLRSVTQARITQVR